MVDRSVLWRLGHHADRGGFAQDQDLQLGTQPQELRALPRDAGTQALAAGQLQVNAHLALERLRAQDAGAQLVAHAGAQSHGRAVGARGLELLQSVLAGLSHGVRCLQHGVTGRGQHRAAPAAATHSPLNQGRAGQIGQGFQGLPSGFVAHASRTRGLRNRAHLVQAVQDVDAFVAGFVAQDIGEG